MWLVCKMNKKLFPGPRRGPQIVPWAAEERMPELALAHNHTDEYFAYHHRTFIWRWMEIEKEIHWNTGLNSLGPNEKQMEGQREQRRQDQREPSSNDGWR